jgi:hypothetical protein
LKTFKNLAKTVYGATVAAISMDEDVVRTKSAGFKAHPVHPARVESLCVRGGAFCKTNARSCGITQPLIRRGAARFVQFRFNLFKRLAFGFRRFHLQKNKVPSEISSIRSPGE